MLRWRTTVAATASLVCLAYATASATAGKPPSEVVTITASGSHGDAAAPFLIAVAGKAPGAMYPGITRDVILTLKNPYGFSIKVSTLRAEVAESSKRRCKATSVNLVAKSYVGRLPLVIPARGQVRAGAVPLSMPWGASPHCQGAKFTIRLSGTATKANR